jgi:hypothetical protein
MNQVLEGAVDITEKSQSAINEFLYWHYLLQVQPKVLTQYRRKAYLSTVDDYARVTFDRDMRYHPEPIWNVVPNEKMLQHYDHGEVFKDTQSFVILELKSTTKVPLWIIDLIKYFNLRRESISKFENAMLSEFLPIESHTNERVFQIHR